MSEAVFVVLRTATDTVETIGPSGAKFSSFEEADGYAKALRDRYTAQSFIVCEAVTAYATQMMGTVSKFGSEKQKPKQRKTLPKKIESTSATSDDENVFPMHPRKVAGK